MDYAQDRVTTLHDLGGDPPAAPVAETAVLLPMTSREHASLAAERTLTALEEVGPASVIVPMRAPPGRIGQVRAWLESFELPLELLWCTGPRLEELLADRGLDGEAGKGRDLWLGLGLASAEHPYVVCHDADRHTYSVADVPRLLAPLDDGFSFTKGYYARVEDRRLYGRLCRLCYRPLVRALADAHDAPILKYLDAFRYALAGECGMTAELARSIRIERQFGLEVGTLGEVYRVVGTEGTAQVDLGRYEHDHRAVSGPSGLADMSRDVAAALLRTLETHGVDPDYATLPDRVVAAADVLVEQYAADARHNGLEYDRQDEREQARTYAAAIGPPGEDDRLPPWSAASLTVEDVRAAADADLEFR